MLLLPLPLLIDDAVEVTGELLSPTFCEFSQAFRAHSILLASDSSILLLPVDTESGSDEDGAV